MCYYFTHDATISTPYECDDERYERLTRELDAFDSDDSDTNDDDDTDSGTCGPSIYFGNGAWHYRGNSRVQRSDVGLKGRGSVSAEFAASLIVQCMTKAICDHMLDLYLSHVRQQAQNAIGNYGKQLVYAATHGTVKTLFPARRRYETTTERHARQVELWYGELR